VSCDARATDPALRVLPRRFGPKARQAVRNAGKSVPKLDRPRSDS
jgi:hypothetical protein